MKCKPNIGVINSLIRITCGLTVLAVSSARWAKKPWRQSYLFWAMMGAMKVGEGILQYCPVVDFVNSMNWSDWQNKPEMKRLIDMFAPKQEDNNQKQGFGPTN